MQNHRVLLSLQALFSTQSGIGLSFVRIAIGGTDFQAVEPYTYDDLKSGETDFSLDHFSLEADKEFIIPVLKKIKAVNPAVRFLATPWSAPAWMKENPENATLFGGTLSSRPEVLQSYANFFVKFLQAYEAEGIPIDLVTVQNEPGHSEDTYPTMMMSAELQTTFIKQYLGPTLRANHVKTGIVIYDHNWDNIAFPLQILSDPEAKAFINGTAFHCYAGSSTAPLELYKKHPDVSIYFTECSGGIWDRTFSSAISWEVKHLLMDQTRSGAKMVLLWNMALDGNYGPKVGVGGCEKCRGVISIYEDGGFRKEAEYYSLGHFSKFVFPGANRTDSENFSDRSLETAAYLNVDGSVVAIVLNTHDKRSRSFCLKLYGKTYQYKNLPLQSVVTFVYTPATQNP